MEFECRSDMIWLFGIFLWHMWHVWKYALCQAMRQRLPLGHTCNAGSLFFFEKVRFRKGGLKWIRIGVWCHFFNQLWSQWIMVHDVSNIFFHSRMSSFPLTFTPSFFKMGTASTTKQYQPWIQSAHDCGSRMGRVVWHPKAGILGLFFTRFDVSTETRGKTTGIRDSDRFGDFFTFKWKGSR